MLEHATIDTDIVIDNERFEAAEIIASLEPFVSAPRRARIARVVASRTLAITPVLEGLHDRGNASAVLRSAEAMGLLRVHIVELLKKFKKANRVTQGAEKWLDIARWETTAECVAHLKDTGYRIVATAMKGSRPLDEVPFDRPTALVFGNEHAGVSDELLSMCDERVRIPMDGFTRSFNISVAAALAFYHIRQDRIRRLGQHGDLSAIQRERLKALYYIRSVGSAAQLLLRARGAAG